MTAFQRGRAGKAVVVKIADRQWRYSRFPELPLFAAPRVKAASRATAPSVKRCRNVLRTCRLTCRKPSACISRSAAFIGSHLGVAFEADPEAEIRKLNTRLAGELERAIANHESDNQQSRVQFEQAKEGVAAFNRILPRLNLLADDAG